MNFQESITTCLRKYADFSGRATRPEYWWFFLAALVASLVLAPIHAFLQYAFVIAMLVPWLAAGARRLHDTERTGWWQLLLLIPFVGLIVLLILMAQPTRQSAVVVPGTIL